MYIEWTLCVRCLGMYEKWYTVIDFVSSSCSSSCGIGGCGDGGGAFCCFFIAARVVVVAGVVVAIGAVATEEEEEKRIK